MEYYSKKLLELQRQFDGTKYSLILAEYCKAYLKEDYLKMNETLKKFPTEIQLLEKLTTKLKGKSVFTNLRKIFKNERVSEEDKKIALSSLYTHICIEIKKGNKEYAHLGLGILKKLVKLETEKEK